MSYDYTERKRANELSRLTADAHGEIWEPYELELLEEGWVSNEATLPEIAELLGRTIEACRQKHSELARMSADATRRAKQAKSSKNSQWDRGWTSVEDMGF